MADKYYRLVSFLINICPEPLRELFLQNAKSDTKPGIPYTSLDAYLASRKPDILSLKSRRILRNDQYNLLYPNSGPADESQWDITLLAVLILELFPSYIPNHVQFFVKDIREVRNSLQHVSKTSSISDSVFQKNWNRLEIATLTLAKVVNGTNYENVMKEKIETARISNMPDLGNTLCLWFMEINTQNMTEMAEMKEKIKKISEDTKESKAKASESAYILQNACMAKPGPTGKTNKRMKIVDKKLKNMQDQYQRRLNAEIPEDFNAPNEIDSIKEKLRDNHLVIVAGQNNSLYVAAALTAVKDMGYNEKRCVEMQSSSDWNHVDPEDVDFVLCCNPFGGEVYDEEKARGMAGKFNSIQQTVKEDRDDKKLAVLIVTDIGVLNECKEKHYHDILEEVVTVYHSTSETQPADLTVDRCNKTIVASTISQNLADQTRLFLDHHKRRVHPDILKTAKDKFKAFKSVVLIGEPRCGKTSLAVALAASYHPSQVLLLERPEQDQHVDQNRIHLVVIEDFAGKYDYNKTNICNWYKTFDLLHVIRSAGKLNIIITCDKQKFKECTETIATHPLLDPIVEIHHKTVPVKQETSNTTVSQAQTVTVETVSIQNETGYPDRESPLNAPRFTSDSVVSKEECINLSYIIDTDYVDCTSMCLTEDKSLYVAVRPLGLFECSNYYLLYHDKNTNKTFKYSVKDHITSMCCTTTSDVIFVSLNRSPSILRIIDGSPVIIKTIQGKEHWYCQAVSCDDEDQIYTLWTDGTIKIYNISLEILEQYRTPKCSGYTENSVISPKGHIFICSSSFVHYENFRSKSSSDRNENFFLGTCICVVSEDPYTVFMNDISSNRLVQYNTKCQRISEIPFTIPNIFIYTMVFDETSSRLIIFDKNSQRIYYVYLK